MMLMSRVRVLAGVLGVLGLLAVCSSASAASVGWKLNTVATPSRFSAEDTSICSSEEKCDAFQILLENVGAATAEGGAIVLTDRLPANVTAVAVSENHRGTEWICHIEEAGSLVKCAYERHEEEPAEVAPASYARPLRIEVAVSPSAPVGPVTNVVSVTGDGASAEASEGIQLGGPPQGFAITKFGFEPGEEDGSPATAGGGRPWEATTSLGVTSTLSSPGGKLGTRPYAPVKNIKSVNVELPDGFAGDPLATKVLCTEVELRRENCPSQSAVGIYGVIGGLLGGEYQPSGFEPGVSSIYNMVPQHGYPAQLGFLFGSIPVELYATVVRAPANGTSTAPAYRLRVSAPALPEILETISASMTFFGDPGRLDEGESGTAFLTSPGDCASAPLSARLETNPWSEPGNVQSAESVAYQSLTGCGILPFAPSLSFKPSGEGEGGTSQADEPSAYTADLTLPQSSAFSQAASSEIRNAVVTLPEGLSVNPAAGQGLAGCEEQGPHGINIGSGKIGAGGRDEEDPEATELGAGHPGGNGSAYDDGIYHIAKGHCPDASIIGTAEITTPLLSTPLTGHVFAAMPKCGEEGEAACTPEDATNGRLFGAYLEVEGSGVIVKLASTLSANLSTGQLTATFRENPQLPVSEVKLNLRGGPRGVFANPQACGQASTTSVFEPWSGGGAAHPGESFPITGCAATLPFAPAFTAGSTPPTAGAGTGSTSFSTTITRQDREGDISGVQVTLPAGVSAAIASVPLCGEPDAQNGTCPAGSLIGTTTVLAGAGSTPLSVTGQVFLTGPYQGAPFGLSIVVPANAGPFHLGNDVVRAALSINPYTGAATVTASQVPLIKDGVPFRLRAINVNINRAGFVINPTNCAAQQVTATISDPQGQTAPGAAPFAVTGCTGLPFKPSFTVSTQGRTSKKGGASLTVKISQHPGEANIQKVHLQLPIKLPTRQATLGKACLAAVFEANPAGCSEESIVGTATASTPILSEPLRGPAYLVSHGGAAFPDLEYVLQGEGVTIILDGKTDIKKGITYSSFQTVPDDPISSFQTTLPEGPHSILAAYGSLCKPTQTITMRHHSTRRIHGRLRHITTTTKKTVPQPLVMPTLVTGQNNATLKQTTKISVTECPKTTVVPKKHKASKGKRAKH